MQIRLRDVIAPHFWSVFNHFKMHNIIYGGRGSTKTSMIALYQKQCTIIRTYRTRPTIRNSSSGEAGFGAYALL